MSWSKTPQRLIRNSKREVLCRPSAVENRTTNEKIRSRRVPGSHLASFHSSTGCNVRFDTSTMNTVCMCRLFDNDTNFFLKRQNKKKLTHNDTKRISIWETKSKLWSYCIFPRQSPSIVEHNKKGRDIWIFQEAHTHTRHKNAVTKYLKLFVVVVVDSKKGISMRHPNLSTTTSATAVPTKAKNPALVTPGTIESGTKTQFLGKPQHCRGKSLVRGNRGGDPCRNRVVEKQQGHGRHEIGGTTFVGFGDGTRMLLCFGICRELSAFSMGNTDSNHWRGTPGNRYDNNARGCRFDQVRWSGRRWWQCRWRRWWRWRHKGWLQFQWWGSSMIHGGSQSGTAALQKFEVMNANFSLTQSTRSNFIESIRIDYNRIYLFNEINHNTNVPRSIVVVTSVFYQRQTNGEQIMTRITSPESRPNATLAYESESYSQTDMLTTIERNVTH